MSTQFTSILALVIAVPFVVLAPTSVYAFRGHTPNIGMLRRVISSQQQAQKQQAKQFEAYQKAAAEYQKQAQEAFLLRQAEKKAAMNKRHEKLEQEKQARIEKNKKHNEELKKKELESKNS